MNRYAYASFCLAICCFLTAGCGGGSNGEEKLGGIVGKVTHQGKTLPGGMVTFHIEAEGGEKLVSPTSINEDGTYKIQLVKPGKARLAVDTQILKGSPRYVAIPLKYANPTTSGLTFDISKGNQSKDIELK